MKRVDAWIERGRALGGHIQAARSRHLTVEVGVTVFERDGTIGGAMLAGALAYRLFVFLLPATLFLVSGIGLYADAAGKSTSQAAHDSGLHGLIAAQVADAASSKSRWLLFLIAIPALLYTTATLYRALATVHAIVWRGSGRGLKLTPRAFGVFGGALLAQLVCLEVVSLGRRYDQLAGVAALLVYLVGVGGSWLVVSWYLPRRPVPWTALLPGAVLFGVGMLFVNAFNVYVTARLVEDRADTYGALGIATALLLSLVLVGRLMVGSAVLNSSVEEIHRTRSST